jgi:hypothetical protein
VAGSKDSFEVQQRLDELRRSLYRDGATDEDLRRYAEERTALLDDPEPPTESLSDRTPRRKHRLLVAAAAGAVALFATIGIAVTARPVHPFAVPTPTPHAAPVRTGTLQDIGDGQALLQEAKVITSPPIQVVIVGGTAATARQYLGIGDAVVALDLSTAPVDGNSGVVMLSSSKPSPIEWRALRLRTRRDWTPYEQVVARGTVIVRPGIQSRIDLHYVSPPPSRIAIRAPFGVRWTALVAFLSDSAPPPR